MRPTAPNRTFQPHFKIAGAAVPEKSVTENMLSESDRQTYKRKRRKLYTLWHTMYAGDMLI